MCMYTHIGTVFQRVWKNVLSKTKLIGSYICTYKSVIEPPVRMYSLEVYAIFCYPTLLQIKREGEMPSIYDFFST